MVIPAGLTRVHFHNQIKRILRQIVFILPAIELCIQRSFSEEYTSLHRPESIIVLPLLDCCNNIQERKMSQKKPGVKQKCKHLNATDYTHVIRGCVRFHAVLGTGCCLKQSLLEKGHPSSACIQRRSL